MRDIEAIFQQLQLVHPDVRVEQLPVTHRGADDDGLWFFSHPTSDVEVQLESSTANCPFLIERTGSADRLLAGTVPQAVAFVATALGLAEPAA